MTIAAEPVAPVAPAGAPAVPDAGAVPAVQPVPSVVPGTRDWIPLDIRDDPGLKDFKDPGDMAKAWVARGKLFSKQNEGMVKVPGEGATPEQIATYRKAIGVPGSAEEYGLDVAEDLRHLVPKESLGVYAAMFHDLGIPKAQAQQLVTRHAEMQANLVRGIVTEYAKQREALKTQWGPETFDRRLTLASRAIEVLVNEEDHAFLNRPGIAGHPFFLRLFARLGEEMAEDGIIQSDVAGVKTTEAMASRAQEIIRDPQWLAGKHPQQEALTAEYTKLQRQLTPEPIR